MSDISDLEGVYPSSLRFNAEEGFLGFSTYNYETGERELQLIEFGVDATFVLDLATRERGYGYVRIGIYDMRLTPVGSPPPPWSDDFDFKPAVGCWLWCPSLGELRLETNGAHFRQAISNIWDRARRAPEAATGAQPIIRFTGCVTAWNKKFNKNFFAPKVEIVGWVERDQVPGWSARTPTVPLPAPLPVLPLAAATPPDQPKPEAKKAAKGPPGAANGGSSLSDYREDDLPEHLSS
jgi:hypothetical protein